MIKEKEFFLFKKVIYLKSGRKFKYRHRGSYIFRRVLSIKHVNTTKDTAAKNLLPEDALPNNSS
jgi:hypothetical protein